MKKDIDLLANRFILLKSGNPAHLTAALQQTQIEVSKSRPFYLLPDRLIICRINEAGEAVKYISRAIAYAGALCTVPPGTLTPENEEHAMAVAAGLARHLQYLVAARISTLPLRVEITGGAARFEGESLPVRLLNTLIVLEAVLLLQLHVAVRGRFTEPDELCVYCWGLFGERELLDALKMPRSVGLSSTHFAECIRAIRDLAAVRRTTVKRLELVAKGVEAEVPREESDWLGPVVLALLLVLLMVVLVRIKQLEGR